MKYYSSAEELIGNGLTLANRSQLYPIVEDGVKVYNQILDAFKDWFQSDFIGNVNGPLLSYCIARHFEPDLLSKQFPFLTVPEKVNNFGYKSLNLLKDNIIINVGKAYFENGLPFNSNYRRMKCLNNNFNEPSLFFDVSDFNNMFLNTGPYYCFLTYRVKEGQLTNVNLIVPNQYMTTCLESIDLKTEFSMIVTTPEETVTREKQVAKLKKEILQMLNLEKSEEDE